jgi:hypothetical protein
MAPLQPFAAEDIQAVAMATGSEINNGKFAELILDYGNIKDRYNAINFI